MVMVEGNEDSGKDLKSEEIVENGTLLEKNFDGSDEVEPGELDGRETQYFYGTVAKTAVVNRNE